MLPTLESPGWASSDPSNPSGRLPSFLFCCLFFKGELNTLTKQETQPQHQPRLSHNHTLQCPVPFMGGPRALSCYPLSSSLVGATCLPLIQAQSRHSCP